MFLSSTNGALRPAVVPGTRNIAPLTTFGDLDRLGLLKDVPTLNFHPHLPHYELAEPNGTEIHVLAKSAGRSRSAASVHGGRQHRNEQSFVDAAGG